MSTPEKSSLAERMEQARLRTVAARGPQSRPAEGGPHLSPLARAPHPAHALQSGRGVGGAGPGAAAAPHGPHSTHKAQLPYTQGHGHGHAQHSHAHDGHKGHHGPAWQVPAAAGDHLVLMPGQMHFGALAASVRTLLGSCVAVTLWHPGRRIGGMCHYLLPTRNRASGVASDGRYGDEAIEAMVGLLRKAGTEPSDYQAHLYGGADTMPGASGVKFNVGERNIEQGFSLVDRYGFQIQGVDVGEDMPRSVHLVLATGAVEMRRSLGKAPPPATLDSLAPAAPAARRKHHV